MSKKNLFSLSWPIVVLLLSSACSGLAHKRKSPTHTSDESAKIESVEQQEKEEDNTQKLALDEARKRLEDLVNEAKASGPEAVQFLASDLFLKAADASVRGDSFSAAFIYEYILKLYPDDAFLKKKYVIELVRSGDLEKSLIVLEQNKKQNMDDLDMGLILGGVYTALENSQEAKLVYSQLVKKFPKSEEACVFLAKSWALDKSYQKAYSLLDSCQTKNKGKGIFDYYKGKMALTEGKKDKAKQYFEQSLKQEADYYQSALGIGLIYEEQESYAKAIAVYKGFLKRDPEQFTILGRLVQILFSQGKFSEVIPYAEKLVNLDPSDLNLKVRLGVLYTDANRLDEAKKIFEDVLVEVPDSDKVLYYLASLYQQTGEIDKALTHFSNIPENSPLFHEGHIQIGHILNAKALEAYETDQPRDKQDEGQKRLMDFIETTAQKDPELKIEMNILAAGHFEAKGQIKEAVARLESIENEKLFDEGHRYYLATLLEKDQRFNDAREMIRKIINSNPNNAHALNFLGYSFLEKNENMNEAFQLISKAVELRPKDGYIRDSLGWYYYRTGNLKKALQETKKAWDLVKTDVVITKHLAVIYGELKMMDLAQKYFTQALKNCRMASEKSEVLKAMEPFDSIRLPASIE